MICFTFHVPELRSIEVPVDNLPVIVGRSERVAVRVPDPLASRQHCEIDWHDGLSVRDLESTNGTLLNGEPVESAVLCSGDVLTVGDLEIGIAFDQAAIAAARQTGSIAATR